MAILVTGARVRSDAGTELSRRAWCRGPRADPFARKGTLSCWRVRGEGRPFDIDSVRTALDGVSTLFLLAPNAPDELTQAMLTFNAPRDAGVKGIVYLSVFKGEAYATYHLREQDDRRADDRRL